MKNKLKLILQWDFIDDIIYSCTKIIITYKGGYSELVSRVAWTTAKKNEKSKPISTQCSCEKNYCGEYVTVIVMGST